MTLDTKALEAAAKAVNDAIDTHGEFAIHTIAVETVSAYLSATPSRNDILEEAARVAEGEVVQERYRAWLFERCGRRLVLQCLDGGNYANDSERVRHCDKIAAAIRALVKP